MTDLAPLLWGAGLSPLEIVAALILVTLVSAGMTSHKHTETDTEVWYCFICAGAKQEIEIEEKHNAEVE